MTSIEAFTPFVNATATAVATTTATNLTLTTRASNGNDNVRIYNAGPNVAYIEIGAGTATITSSMPILVGSTEKFGCPPGVTTISIICALGTAALSATLGKGI